jgi:hypothetical protein
MKPRNTRSSGGRFAVRRGSNGARGSAGRDADLRRRLRADVRRVLPAIVEHEVRRLLDRMLGRARR